MIHVLTMFMLQGPAFAGDEQAPEPPVEISGVLYGHYTFSLTEGADNYNEFGMDRVYFRGDANINDHFGTRVTMDADHFKDSTIDTKYRVFLKHAYLEWKDPAPGVKLRVGIIDAPLGPYFDEFWNHRFISDNYAAWAVKLPTADLGVGAYGKHKKGLVNWAAVLVNGEGYSKLEVDAGKQVQGRLTIDPLAGGDKMKLPITAYAGYSTHPDADAELLASGAIGFEMPALLVSGQGLMKSVGDTTGVGFSAILMPRVPKVVTGIFRYDTFDPDTDVDDDAATQMFVGASHFFAKKVSLAMTYERSWTEATAETPNQGLALRWQAGF